MNKRATASVLSANCFGASRRRRRRVRCRRNDAHWRRPIDATRADDKKAARCSKLNARLITRDEVMRRAFGRFVDSRPFIVAAALESIRGKARPECTRSLARRKEQSRVFNQVYKSDGACRSLFRRFSFETGGRAECRHLEGGRENLASRRSAPVARPNNG